MNYYRRYVGDYLRDTARLTLLEHGAYTLLLDYYYADQAPLPLGRDEVYLIVRAMTPAEKKAVDKVLMTYFQEREDGFHQARADAEIERATAASEVAKANGKRGGRPRKQSNHETNRETNPVSNAESNEGNQQAKPYAGDPTTNHQPPTTNLQPEGARTREERDARIRRGWWASEAGIVEAGLAVGLRARPGESLAEFKARVETAINPPPPPKASAEPEEPPQAREEAPQATRGALPVGSPLAGMFERFARREV